MTSSSSQKGLFSNQDWNMRAKEASGQLRLSKELLMQWQDKIDSYQAELFKGLSSQHTQPSLFAEPDSNHMNSFEPLSLKPLPLSFWRWPESPHEGPAIYLVMDRIEKKDSQILLYIGETVAANRRWKGDHDCKDYLASYCEALANVGIKHQLSIRFWSDVPTSTKARRAIEQQLIQKWLPPFNKETRSRWKTPFTYELH